MELFIVAVAVVALILWLWDSGAQQRTGGQYHLNPNEPYSGGGCGCALMWAIALGIVALIGASAIVGQ